MIASVKVKAKKKPARRDLNNPEERKLIRAEAEKLVRGESTRRRLRRLRAALTG